MQCQFCVERIRSGQRFSLVLRHSGLLQLQTYSPALSLRIWLSYLGVRNLRYLESSRWGRTLVRWSPIRWTSSKHDPSLPLATSHRRCVSRVSSKVGKSEYLVVRSLAEQDPVHSLRRRYPHWDWKRSRWATWSIRLHPVTELDQQ